ncbi:MAG: reverse transcriptase family protein [gamma proteobacterium symbiont of Lucinoma myriamae]|nr:reverse transcriptase family protein [gamma proteobacterium symbiont of Lucinoma myriamae]
MFILIAIVRKFLNENKKLYCSFIDFRKAFDLVYRNGIWFKLLQMGVSCKLVKTVQSLYHNVKACVRGIGTLSECFESHVGVKQGEPLSPLLFILFLNDLSDFLQGSSNNEDLLTIDHIQIFLLLFADDTLLLSESKQGLQNLLDKLHLYCTKWNVTVNIEKTKVMVFKNGTRLENVDFYYNNMKLEMVKKFTYLGVIISSNGKFYQSQKHLAEQARKALFSLNNLFDCTMLHIKDKLKLFDCMILPILMYGCEIWGFHDSSDIERVHLKFLKQLLGVRSQTCD